MDIPESLEPDIKLPIRQRHSFIVAKKIPVERCQYDSNRSYLQKKEKRKSSKNPKEISGAFLRTQLRAKDKSNKKNGLQLMRGKDGKVSDVHIRSVSKRVGILAIIRTKI